VKKLDDNKLTNNPEEFKKAIYNRENEISTAVGDGIAIPHDQSKYITKQSIIMGRTLNGIDYGGQHTNLIFIIAAPEDASDFHLSLLSNLSAVLMDVVFPVNLFVSTSCDDIIEAIREQEKKDLSSNQDDSGKYIAGITACMTGIAHTYMASEAIKSAAAEKT